jgi:hypothetical protein
MGDLLKPWGNPSSVDGDMHADLQKARMNSAWEVYHQALFDLDAEKAKGDKANEQKIQLLRKRALDAQQELKLTSDGLKILESEKSSHISENDNAGMAAAA